MESLGLWKYVEANLKSIYVTLPHFPHSSFLKKKNFSSYVLLIDQISLSGCIYFVKYRAICVLELLRVNHVAMSLMLRLT